MLKKIIIDTSLCYYSNLDNSIKSARGSFRVKNPKINLDKTPNIFNTSLETARPNRIFDSKLDFSGYKKKVKK